MSSQRRSRPSSAASRSSVRDSDIDIKVECRAAFLGRYEDIRDEIDSKDDLIMRMYMFKTFSLRFVYSKKYSK